MSVTLSIAAASLLVSSTHVTTSTKTGAQTFRLANGLRVHLDPMPDRSTVSVMVGYRAGAAAAPTGRHGLAHLVEHLVFRRAGRYGPFAGSDYVQNSGGSFNGLTAPHRTWYEATISPSALDALLLFERERMGFSGAEITEEDLRLEQAIVARELELREGAGSRVMRVLDRGLFPEGTLWAGVDNERDEVARHTLEEVRWFLERHYRPDQAVLVIAGRFELEPVRERIQRWFEPLPNPPTAPASYAPPSISDPRTLTEVQVRSRDRTEHIEYRWWLPTEMGPGERALVEYVLEELARRVRRAHKEVARRSDAGIERLAGHDVIRIWVSSWASKRLDAVAPTFREQIDTTRADPSDLVSNQIEKGRIEAELRVRRSMTTPEEHARVALHALLDDEAPTMAERVSEIRAVSAQRAVELIGKILSEEPVMLRHVRHDGGLEVKEVARAL